MTLITNEIHIQDSLNRSAILFTSDRRITRKGKYDNTKQKLFSIDYIHSGVSFFGLAEVFPNGRRIYLSDWLKDYGSLDLNGKN